MKTATILVATMIAVSSVKADERSKWDVKTSAHGAVAAFAASEHAGEWLVLQCSYNKITASIIASDGKFTDGERASVIITIDNRKPVRTFFWYETNQLMSGVYREAYSAIVEAKSISIEAHGERGGRYSAVYRPGNGRKSLNALLRSCPISSAREGDWALYDPNRPEFP